MITEECTEKNRHKNIKTDNGIVMLINELNQEGINLEEYYGKGGKIKASINAAEDNLKSSTEAKNNNIDTQSNNIVVDNALERKSHGKILSKRTKAKGKLHGKILKIMMIKRNFKYKP